MAGGTEVASASGGWRRGAGSGSRELILSAGGGGWLVGAETRRPCTAGPALRPARKAAASAAARAGAVSGWAGAADDDGAAAADMGPVADAGSYSFLTGYPSTARSKARMGGERTGRSFRIRGRRRQGRPEEGDQPGVGTAGSPVAGMFTRYLCTLLVGTFGYVNTAAQLVLGLTERLCCCCS